MGGLGALRSTFGRGWPLMTALRVQPSVLVCQTADSAGSAGSAGSNMGRCLDDVRHWLSRFISVTDARELDLLALWAAHTYLAYETYSTPRLQIDSTMPGSGKTTVLEHLARLAWHPVQAASLSSPALLVRILDKGIRTILIDEVDRNLDPKRQGVEEFIAILNSGYKRGATRPVLVPGKGGEWDVKEMPTFSPVAMAGNAPSLPDDTRSRCIRVLLMPDFEGSVEASDWEELEPAAMDLGHRLRLAADEVREAVRTIRPELPDGCVGRLKEKWAPLARVAAVSDGDWSARVDDLIRRDIMEVEMEREEGLARLPAAVVLLRDIHAVWRTEDTFTATTELIRLLAMHRPDMWGDASPYGRRLTVQRMGRMLVQAFKIHSTRLGTGPRGYPRAIFDPIWRRFKLDLHETDGTGSTAGTGHERGTAFAACSLHTEPVRGCYTCDSVAR